MIYGIVHIVDDVAYCAVAEQYRDRLVGENVNVAPQNITVMTGADFGSFCQKYITQSQSTDYNAFLRNRIPGWKFMTDQAQQVCDDNAEFRSSIVNLYIKHDMRKIRAVSFTPSHQGQQENWRPANIVIDTPHVWFRRSSRASRWIGFECVEDALLLKMKFDRPIMVFEL